MSESLFLNQHIREFAASHPQEEGWKVYEFSGSLVHKYGFCHLIEFLHERHRQAIMRQTTMTLLLEEELIAAPAHLHPAEEGSEWDLGRELDGKGWFGLVHLRWMGQPIHILSALIFHPNGYENVFHVCTKSNVAMRRFFHELQTYGLSKEKTELRKIYVANGEDIPILPMAWEDIILPAGLVESIRRNVEMFFKSEERYRDLGIPYRRGLLFAGPPGCGKTTVLKALAYNTSGEMITVLGTAQVDDGAIDMAFQRASTHQPAIIFLEDLDKLVASEHVSLPHFLNLLDGFRALNGVMVIATANEPKQLDQALLFRPSRFDRVWTFPLPDFDQRLALLHKRGGTYFSRSALQDVAKASQGFTMAFVQEIVVNALLDCAHQEVEPEDRHLLDSLEALRIQRKLAAKPSQSLECRENVGFACNGSH